MLDGRTYPDTLRVCGFGFVEKNNRPFTLARAGNEISANRI